MPAPEPANLTLVGLGLLGEQQLANQVPCAVVAQVVIFIKCLTGAADHNFRLVDHIAIEEDENLTQIIWRPRCAQAAGAGPHNGHRLVVKGLFRRSGGPVEGVLQGPE